MKKILVSLLFVPVMASAKFFSGNDLLREMNGSDADQMLAIGYVMGVVDVHSKESLCLPANIRAGQLHDTVKLFIEQNPTVRHYSASSLILYRLEQVWPCDNQQQKQQQKGRGA